MEKHCCSGSVIEASTPPIEDISSSSLFSPSPSRSLGSSVSGADDLLASIAELGTSVLLDTPSFLSRSASASSLSPFSLSGPSTPPLALPSSHHSLLPPPPPSTLDGHGQPYPYPRPFSDPSLGTADRISPSKAEEIERRLRAPSLQRHREEAEGQDAGQRQPTKVKRRLLGSSRPYHRAIKTLEELNVLSVPADMTHCLLATARQVYKCAEEVSRANVRRVSSKAADMGADLFFPIFLYVVVHARLSHVHSRLEFMRCFWTPNANYASDDDTGSDSEKAYYLTTFEAAVLQVMTSTADTFRDRGKSVEKDDEREGEDEEVEDEGEDGHEAEGDGEGEGGDELPGERGPEADTSWRSGNHG